MVNDVPALISTMGFDVDHIITLYGKYTFDKLVLLIPRGADIRTYNAIEALRKVFQRNVVVEDIEIDYRNLGEAVYTIREVIKKNVPCYINLSGGLRILVVEAFLAYITLSSEVRQRVFGVFVVVEGTKEIIEINLGALTLPSYEKLTAGEQLVFEIIKSAGTLTAKEILEELERRGYDYSRPWLYNVLNELIKKGLIERSNRGVYRVRTLVM